MNSRNWTQSSSSVYCLYKILDTFFFWMYRDWTWVSYIFNMCYTTELHPTLWISVFKCQSLLEWGLAYLSLKFLVFSPIFKYSPLTTNMFALSPFLSLPPFFPLLPLPPLLLFMHSSFTSFAGSHKLIQVPYVSSQWYPSNPQNCFLRISTSDMFCVIFAKY